MFLSRLAKRKDAGHFSMHTRCTIFTQIDLLCELVETAISPRQKSNQTGIEKEPGVLVEAGEDISVVPN